ncbi:type 1 fimbrial protein [Erwinia endophytica]|uniref:fimbrial protein n=1 Tax=Erwinia endophytica TaxID=1563158 RepID=UPI0012660685|nr:fimbrial protein [Erwinia endophytica]KAB8313466.1 type 1 fimbrial protein [Erwinia endophytica]
MRNFKMTVCALALGMVSASFVQAATQGTVEFNGKLINDTCVIDPESENIVVTLPTLSVQTLAEAGATGGSTSFDIKVTDCPAAITQVAAHFEAIGGTGTDAATGNLINDETTDPATNVQVRLYDTDEAPLALGNTGTASEVDTTSQTATMRYYGGYYATGTTTAGNVHAKAQYTLAYP